MSGLGPVLACAAYAALLWAVALALDAVGRRSLRTRAGAIVTASAPAADIARFHRAIGGAALAGAAFLLVVVVVARRDGPALLLVPLAALCLGGAVRRVTPLWREP